MLALPHVLLRVFTVFRCRETGSHLRRHNSLSLVEPPLQALKNAPIGQRFSHPPPTHPSHSYRVRRGKPKKPSAFHGEAYASLTKTSICIDPIIVMVRIAFASPRSAEGFSGLWPLARAAVRGVRRRPGNERAPDRAALLSACEAAGSGAAKRSRDRPARVRARPGRRSTGKTRSSPCSISAHGRRTAFGIGLTISCHLIDFRYYYNAWA